MLRRCLLAVPFLLLACGTDAGIDDAAGSPDGDPGSGENPGPQSPSGPTGNHPPALTSCAPSPACDGTTSPTLDPTTPWRHITSNVVAVGTPYHRGRDQIVTLGQKQWVIGKFTYSLADKDLVDEDVDIFLERGCSGAWEKLGTVATTNDDTHPTTEGVDDSGGRVYFEIPADKALGLGRHRVRLVVKGDHSTTDLLIDVVPQNAPIFVSDVDGTLTESENAEFSSVLTGSISETHPGAPERLNELAKLGYRPVYLSARPEWLTNRTRDFIKERGFPPGTIHTTTGLTGARNDAAATFKTGELSQLKDKGLILTWGFGNTDSDATAYETTSIAKPQRVFLRLTDPNGGRRIEAYSEIATDVAAAPAICAP